MQFIPYHMSVALVSRGPSLLRMGRCLVSGRDCIALTIDDGPHPKATEEALATLSDLGLKADFFLTGSDVERYPELVRLIHDEGHACSNHAYEHAQMLILSSKKKCESIDRTSGLIETHTGRRPRYFRPPYGLWWPFENNLPARCDARLIMWSMVPLDFRLDVSVSQIETSFRRRLKAGDIVVLHTNENTSGRIGTVIRALAEVMEERRLKPVLLSEQAFGADAR